MTTTASPVAAPRPLELLAPAGTVPAFEAALREGADAVYVGAPGLNARALARDFTFGEIAAMTECAHDQGKKVYVAMNSLMKEGEVRQAVETLSRLARIGPDALILQDLGIFHLVRRFFPSLKVHASTLMTVNNALAARYFKELGFERIVLARELSLEEIRTIHAHCPVELEIFIHGAMCFSYSGLCRFSSLHGGKSSLRGQCVQPCRRRYEWLPSGKRSSCGKTAEYLFSMNDLSGIDHLTEVRAAGVVSLKIEGRLKSVEYVRNTVRAYRLALRALDTSPEQRPTLLAEAHRCLDAAMGRKRSPGFLVRGWEDRLIIPRFAGSSGEMVGKVTRMEEGRESRTAKTLRLQATLQTPIRLGDRLRLYEERSGERKSFTLRSLEVKGRKVDQADKGQVVSIAVSGLELSGFPHRSHGLLFRVDVSGRFEQQSGLVRRFHPQRSVDPDPMRLQQILTALAMGSASPPSRDAATDRGGQGPGKTSRPQWWLKAASLDAAGMRFPFQVARLVLELNQRNLDQVLQLRRSKSPRHPPLVWALPPIVLQEQLAWYHQAVQRLRGQGATAFQISHIGQLGLFTEAPGSGGDLPLEVYGAYSCNLLNSSALELHGDRGLAGVQFSLETDRVTLAAALAQFHKACNRNAHALRVGLLVYGRPPLFSARLDAPHFQGQRTFVSSRGERFYLDRREGTVYARSHVPFSLLQHVQDITRMGVNYLVVDISHGQPKRECSAVTALLSGRGEEPSVFSGNYAGTLA